MSVPDYDAKLRRIAGQTLLPKLATATGEYLRDLAGTYRFTFQELRAAAQAARDLEMWNEEPLERWWPRAENRARGEGRERKKALLRDLEAHLGELARCEKSYPREVLSGHPRRHVHLGEKDSSGAVFGRCPAYSEHTVCCGLRNIDAVRGCPFGCSYCTIQTFYGDTAELETDLAHKLGDIELDPERFYHIGTGQASDSLVWGNRGGILDTLLAFAARNPNVVLELKTKSDNVEDLLAREISPNVVCSWSLATETIIRNEEHGTASHEKRLRAARRVAEHGCTIGFHFHPMVYYEGWRGEYRDIADRLLSLFSPREVAFVSMGSMTFIRPVVTKIRRRGGSTKVLQMEMVQDAHGKLTYPDEVKTRLFGHLFGALEDWHGRVLFYLCMENATMWETVFGAPPPTSESFEQLFARRCLAV
ncbi:MAG: DNA photolyase [bacterium]|nr:DNA photolyase [bacterium]